MFAALLNYIHVNLNSKAYVTVNINNGKLYIATHTKHERSYIFFDNIKPDPSLKMRDMIFLPRLRYGTSHWKQKCRFEVVYIPYEQTVSFRGYHGTKNMKLENDVFVDEKIETEFLFELSGEIVLDLLKIRHHKYYSRRNNLFYKNGYFYEHDKRYCYKRKTDFGDIGEVEIPPSVLRLCAVDKFQRLQYYKMTNNEDFEYFSLANIANEVTAATKHNIPREIKKFDESKLKFLFDLKFDAERVLSSIENKYARHLLDFSENSIKVYEKLRNSNDFKLLKKINLTNFVSKEVKFEYDKIFVLQKIFELSIMLNLNSIKMYQKDIFVMKNSKLVQYVLEFYNEKESLFLSSSKQLIKNDI